MAKRNRLVSLNEHLYPELEAEVKEAHEAFERGEVR